MDMYRQEHPRPQMRRSDWLNLNGQWNFAFDFSLSGREKGWHADTSAFRERIVVPFCPESRLSGIGHTDFIPSVWYHREFEIPAAWADKKVRLHFGAVDYECCAWINGRLAGTHSGAGSSFCFDITPLLSGGVNSLVVNARDDVRSGLQPAGKQSPRLHSYGCHYTRTTGIWQTVWLEAVPDPCLAAVRITPDPDNSCFHLAPVLSRSGRGLVFRAVLREGTREINSASAVALSGGGLRLDIKNPRLWSPADPFLYDLVFELHKDGRPIDTVHSYAGLRKLHIENNRFFLNNEPVFLRFVLDQGFYPDGLWTAPDDGELRNDIERARTLGFNGARLHQKVFEERFHYWADRLGYLTWGEFHDWGMDWEKPDAVENHRREWREVVLRDGNHPSIIAWTPFNEQNPGRHAERYRRTVREIYDLTKALDPTRPVNDASGWTHVMTDIFTVHDYDQNPDSFARRYRTIDPRRPERACINHPELSVPYRGEPFVVDEYGGTYWSDDFATSAARTTTREEWGYGKSANEVENLLRDLTAALLENSSVAGYTFTQLTDVEQEINGLYTYGRRLKFNAGRLKEIFGSASTRE